MLNGIDPIIIFNFFKKSPSVDAFLDRIPLVSKASSLTPFVPIPIYLSERLTGLFVESEQKSIDIQTEVESVASLLGDQVQAVQSAKVTQKGLNSTITVNLLASKESIGITLLSAMADFAFEKVTSQEYSITYLNGPITIFGGLLHGYSIDQNSNDTLYRISLELSRANSFNNTQEKKAPDIRPPQTGVTL